VEAGILVPALVLIVGGASMGSGDNYEPDQHGHKGHHDHSQHSPLLEMLPPIGPIGIVAIGAHLAVASVFPPDHGEHGHDNEHDGHDHDHGHEGEGNGETERGSGFAAEVVDDEADEEEEEGSEHDPQCDLEHHGYLGGAGAGLISRRKLKNSDLVERIIKSFSDKIFS
jgi:hypothetical protein